MAASGIEERLSYLGLGSGELAVLYELRPVFAARSDEIERSLVGALQAVEPLRERLRYPGVLEYVHSVHREYLLSFTKRRFDETFVAGRDEVGALLESLGIEPEWIIRGFVVFYSQLAPVVSRALLHDDDRASRAVATLAQRVALDVEIIMEGYISRRQEAFAYTTAALQDDLTQRARELQQAREQARLAGELASFGTLAAGLAHEIGTPMGVIQGHARMLQDDPTSPDAGWRLQTIRDQVGRISRIIRTLLRIARPQFAEYVPVRLAPVIEESLEFVGERLRSRRVEVKVSIEPLARVRADVERLQQLFLNLFLNAADAMPEGGELRVDAYQTASDVRVRVSDTGVGIDAADLERIFEPFFTTKEAGHGNGLGLMVSKRIVADHGGSIEVESRPGSGTVFSIRLPRAGGAAVGSEGGPGAS